MIEEQFIPGPWNADITVSSGGIKYSVWDVSGRYQICMGSCDKPKLYDVVEANANLIAKAPEMYHLLKRLINNEKVSMPLDDRLEMERILKEARGEE